MYGAGLVGNIIMKDIPLWIWLISQTESEAKLKTRTRTEMGMIDPTKHRV